MGGRSDERDSHRPRVSLAQEVDQHARTNPSVIPQSDIETFYVRMVRSRMDAAGSQRRGEKSAKG